MEQAWEAFTTQDTELAQEVIASDARIDFMQNELDERAIDVLALQGPVASDLRMIVGALRMSASLERMGDLARHLAQLARLRFPEPVLPESMRAHFDEMFEIDLKLISRVISVLGNRDISQSDEIFALKSELNLKHQQVFEMLAAPGWDSSVPTAVDVTLASRYLERIGDHGVSVARKVSYLVTGDWAPATDTHPTGHGHYGTDAGE